MIIIGITIILLFIVPYCTIFFNYINKLTPFRKKKVYLIALPGCNFWQYEIEVALTRPFSNRLQQPQHIKVIVLQKCSSNLS